MFLKQTPRVEIIPRVYVQRKRKELYRNVGREHLPARKTTNEHKI